MPLYRVDSGRSFVLVRARSRIHDSETRWNRLEGAVQADPNALAGGDTTAWFRVHMASLDAGDWLRNRRLRQSVQPERYPVATFELARLRDVTRRGDDRFAALAEGVVRWRGRTVAVAIAGSGLLDRHRLEATGRFDFDIRDFAVEPPRFLMFAVEPEVTVEMTLWARAENGAIESAA